MTPTLEELVAVGKEAFEATTKAGGFFFPTITWTMVGDDTINIAQFDSGYDTYRSTLMEVAKLAPIEMLATTSDTYHLRSDECPPGVLERYFAGQTSAQTEFAAGTPGAYEALSVVRVTLDAAQGAFLPYENAWHRIKWLEAKTLPEPPSGRYVTAARAALRLSRGEHAAV
jgi:hypothetical protein